MSDSPHPCLSEPILYVLDAPPRVKWHHIASAFTSCGIVRAQRTWREPLKHRTWKVVFQSIGQAEMALATLQMSPIDRHSNTVYDLVLSSSYEDFPPATLSSTFPQFIKCGPAHPLLEMDAKGLFTLFRAAGPLVSVREGVEVGYSTLFPVLHYWDAKHARAAGKLLSLCTERNGWSPAFLQFYNPRKLYLANLSPLLTQDILSYHFSSFGEISSFQVMPRPAHPAGGFGFIEYDRDDSAFKAISALNNIVLDSKIVVVRYHEIFPVYQIFHMGEPTMRTAPPQPQQTREQPPKKDSDHARANGNDRNNTASTPLVDEHAAELAAKEAARKEKARQRQDITQTALDAAVRSESKAQSVREQAEYLEQRAQDARFVVEKERDLACQRLEEAKRAEEQAQHALEIAKRNEEVAHANRREVEDKEAIVRQRKRVAERDKAEAQQDWAEFALAEEVSKKEAEAKRRRDEAERKSSEHERKRERRAREAKIAESIKKMESMRREDAEEKAHQEKSRQEDAVAKSRQKIAELIAQEAARRMEVKAEKERREREELEALRRVYEEEKRKADELRERQERERAEEAKRKRERKKAAARERKRCTARDEARWSRHMHWSVDDALERFKLVSDEFDTIKFDDEQPWTFESVPWPVLLSPFILKIDDIEWATVKAFFKAVEYSVTTTAYRELLQKSQRRFHPDRWRSRGLLSTVEDKILRDRLEAAGNAVSQQVTELWSESRE